MSERECPSGHPSSDNITMDNTPTVQYRVKCLDDSSPDLKCIRKHFAPCLKVTLKEQITDKSCVVEVSIKKKRDSLSKKNPFKAAKARIHTIGNHSVDIVLHRPDVCGCEVGVTHGKVSVIVGSTVICNMRECGAWIHELISEMRTIEYGVTAFSLQSDRIEVTLTTDNSCSKPSEWEWEQRVLYLIAKALKRFEGVLTASPCGRGSDFNEQDGLAIVVFRFHSQRQYTIATSAIFLKRADALHSPHLETQFYEDPRTLVLRGRLQAVCTAREGICHWLQKLSTKTIEMDIYKTQLLCSPDRQVQIRQILAGKNVVCHFERCNDSSVNMTATKEDHKRFQSTAKLKSLMIPVKREKQHVLQSAKWKQFVDDQQCKPSPSVLDVRGSNVIILDLAIDLESTIRAVREFICEHNGQEDGSITNLEINTEQQAENVQSDQQAVHTRDAQANAGVSSAQRLDNSRHEHHAYRGEGTQACPTESVKPRAERSQVPPQTTPRPKDVRVKSRDSTVQRRKTFQHNQYEGSATEKYRCAGESDELE
ncbi:uncharacterized protein [Littorina saxatilis]|uniref:uncharacterized protein n=1 Tax=Littorina saxatilis TaxID=31220 RepID=UPI0038B48851